MSPTPAHATQRILALREELKRERVIKAELLAALKDLQAQYGGGKKSCRHDFNCICVWQNAKAAIAVAEGRKP